MPSTANYRIPEKTCRQAGMRLHSSLRMTSLFQVRRGSMADNLWRRPVRIAYAVIPAGITLTVQTTCNYYKKRLLSGSGPVKRLESLKKLNQVKSGGTCVRTFQMGVDKA